MSMIEAEELAAATRPANPFAVVGRQASNVATANTDQQRAVAEVQAALVIARANPRDQIQAMDRILNACTRPSLADAALYSFSRGGTEITGASIRLAEAMAQAWGNLNYGIREIEQRDGASTVQAYAWDVETNTRREMTFQVAHERHTRSKVTKLTDPRDIYEMVANQGARRLRACILGIIPGDVQESAVQQCEVTLKASADTTPDGIKKLLDAFSKFGIAQEQIEKRIQRRIDTIQPAQVVSLKKVYASLRDGMSKAADWFEGAEDAPASTTLAEIKERAKKPAKADVEDAEPVAKEEPKAKPAAHAGEPAFTFAELNHQIQHAADLDTLDEVGGLIPHCQGGQGQITELNDAYKSRKIELGGAV